MFIEWKKVVSHSIYGLSLVWGIWPKEELIGKKSIHKLIFLEIWKGQILYYHYVMYSITIPFLRADEKWDAWDSKLILSIPFQDTTSVL